MGESFDDEEEEAVVVEGVGWRVFRRERWRGGEGLLVVVVVLVVVEG